MLPRVIGAPLRTDRPLFFVEYARAAGVNSAALVSPPSQEHGPDGSPSHPTTVHTRSGPLGWGRLQQVLAPHLDGPSARPEASAARPPPAIVQL